MAKIFIDNKEYEIAEGKNLLEICLSLGLNLTYFCWHPKMHSVGACRQCAIIQYKDENDTKGKVVMACMQEATNNIRISIDNKKAHDFRAGNIESLMINHPHDCPVCDEGGECHLQDMTLMSGHNYRRYRFNKRTHVNQYLGPFIYHEMNRCIQCYRCVRYYNDYAGGKDFGVFASHDSVYFGRSEAGTLENEFSGNLVEVCPTGVFTDKTLRKHYTRKWDLTNAPSICHQCSVGCNIIGSERYGELRRIVTRFNGDVNGYFLCDRGRFGYEYVNRENRIRYCDKKEGTASGTTIFNEIKSFVSGRSDLIGIGSPRASLESNFLLKKLVGKENFYCGISKQEGQLTQLVLRSLKTGSVRSPSLGEIESYDAVFVLGEDVTNSAPMIALALRQSVKNAPRQKAWDLKIPYWNDAAIREVVQNETGPFYSATPYSTKLDEIATSTFFGNTPQLIRLGSLVVSALKNPPENNNKPDLMHDFAFRVSNDLLQAKKPLIVSGTGMMSAEIINIAYQIAALLKGKGKEAGLTYSVPETNSMGLAMLGENYLEDAYQRVASGKKCTPLILETDLFYQTGEKEATQFLTNCEKVIVLDSLTHKTTGFADFLLPAGTFAESDGTLVNNEGRAQRYYQIFKPNNEIKSSWAFLDLFITKENSPRPFDLIVEEMIAENPEFEKIRSLAPKADFRIGAQKIPREPHRYSGRTAMNANVNVHEPKPPTDPDSPLSYTMEGFQGVPPSPDIPFFWSPGWNSIQAINKYQIEVGGPLHGGNPGVRLFEPGTGENMGENPGTVSPVTGEFEVLPAYHIFGSEELSSLSEPLAERIPAAYIAINGETLSKLKLSEALKLKIKYKEKDIVLPVKINNSLPENVLLLPKGFKETAGIRFPFYCSKPGEGRDTADFK